MNLYSYKEQNVIFSVVTRCFSNKLLQLSGCEHPVSSKGPHIKSSLVFTVYLDEPSICSPLSFKKSVNLNKLSAVIIRLTRFKAPNPLFHKCHLEFEAPKGFGVVAVIEEAKLRLTGYDSCHDYVQVYF